MAGGHAELTPEEEKYFEQRGEIDPPGVPDDEPAAEAPEAEDAEAVSPAAAPSEETPVEPAAGAKPETKPDRHVPLAALLEERRAAQERERKMEERFQLLVQKLAPKQEEPKQPTIEEAPVERLRQLDEQFRSLQQQTIQQQQEANLVNWYRVNANQFAEKQSDFHEAYTFWQQSIAGELADAMGYADPVAIEQQVQQFEKNIAVKAAQDGVNPGERIYKAAQRRGYKLAAPKEDPKPNGATVDQQLETTRRGAAAARTLGTAGGAGNEGALSLRALADMPMDEFLEVSEKAFRRANGV